MDHYNCGCLNGSVGIADTHICGKVGYLATGIKGVVEIGTAGIQGTVNLLTTGIKGVVEIGTVGMQGSVGIICAPNTDVYLFVEPEVIWLTQDTASADFTVRSNTKWIIE